MSLKADVVRDMAIDGAKASPLAVYSATALSGVDWGAVAAAMAALYSAILIAEKLWKLVVQPLMVRFRTKRAVG